LAVVAITAYQVTVKELLKEQELRALRSALRALVLEQTARVGAA
jgi:hypothetical protein